MYSIDWAAGTVKQFVDSVARAEDFEKEFQDIYSDFSDSHLFWAPLPWRRFLVLILAYSDADATHWNRLKAQYKYSPPSRGWSLRKKITSDALAWLFSQKHIDKYVNF